MDDSGISELYFGEPGTGKTTLAMQRCIGRAASRGVPCVFLDPNATLQPPGALIYREAEPQVIVDPIWTNGSHVVYTPPRNQDSVESFFKTVGAGGDVVLLVDECSFYARGERASKELLHLCQLRRHKGVDMFFTSTYCADAHTVVWTTRTKAFIFRNRSAIALERIQRELCCTDQEIETIRNLPDFQYMEF